jgi:uncharacterized membrane protein
MSDQLFDKSATKIIWVILFIITLSIGTYIHKFGFGYWEKPEQWGVLGDFFGGTLNPILAFASLIFLLATLRQNHKALSQSERALEINNQELADSRKELARSAKAQEESKEYQSRQTRIQELTIRVSVISLLLKYDGTSVSERSSSGFSSKTINMKELAHVSSEQLIKELSDIYKELKQLKQIT